MAEHLHDTRAQRENEITISLLSPLKFGDSWVQRFLHRHPELETAISCTIESSRIKETSKEAINKWFDELMEVIKEYRIEIENMYNMDETGFSIGNIQGAYVVVNKELQTKYQVHPGRQEWVTALECVCADGGKIPPFIILKGKNLSSSWIPKESLGKGEVCFGCSEKGWTSNDLGLKWLKNCFEPATRGKAGGRTRMLISDGHESHVSPDFSAFCMEHNIVFFY
jgi:DDE superfamily endonuclease